MCNLPLNGVRIVDLSRVFAMPYAGGFLADLGAEVIRVEACHLPDSRLQLHALPENEPGDDWWERSGTFHTLNRGKRSLTLDLRDEGAQQILRDLIAISDITIENYTPRVTRRFGLDYQNLRKIKPDVIAVSNTGYGHSGPWSLYGGVAATMEPTHGSSAFMSYGGLPSKIGNSYTDFIAAWTAVFAVMAGLIHRSRTGRGLWVDLAMYQVGAAFAGEGILDFALNGKRQRHIGNRHRSFAPHGCYPCKGLDEWVVLAVQNDSQWADFCQVIGMPQLVSDPRYIDIANRYGRQDEIDVLIKEWTQCRDKYLIMNQLQNLGIPCGPVLKTKDLFKDPHYKERNFFETASHSKNSKMGRRKYLGRGWRFSRINFQDRRPGPELGEANNYILEELLNVPSGQIDRLRELGIIGRMPVDTKAPHPLSLNRQKELGWIQATDQNYQRFNDN